MDQYSANQLPPKPDNGLVWAILYPLLLFAIRDRGNLQPKSMGNTPRGLSSAVDSASKAKTRTVSFGIGLIGGLHISCLTWF